MPQYVQVPLVRPKSPSESAYLVPALEDYFKRRCARTVVQFGAGMRFLKAPFHVFFCPDSYVSNALPNRAIASLVEGVQPAPKVWPGLVLVLKLSGHGRHDYVDITREDVPDIREFFAMFH